MADPISVTGLVIAIAQVISTLYDYGTEVKGSKDDIRKMTQEIFALKGALEHISANSKSRLVEGGEDRLAQYSKMIEMTEEALENIQKKLGEPKTRFEKTKRALAWPFTKAELDKYVASIERSKTWFVMVIMNDTAEMSSGIYSEMRQLAEAIHEDTIQRRMKEMMKDTEDILHWLAPINSEEEHLKISQTRVPGTGDWFLDKHFEDWLQSDLLTTIWVTGKCKILSILACIRTYMPQLVLERRHFCGLS